jgi:hypothetical protein
MIATRLVRAGNQTGSQVSTGKPVARILDDDTLELVSYSLR